MGVIGQAEVKVSSDVLVNQAAEVEKNAREMKSNFENLQKTIANTENYWLGEAGEAHRKLYKDQLDKIDNILRRLMEHPVDLRAIAGNYEAAENKNVETAKALPVNEIE